MKLNLKYWVLAAALTTAVYAGDEKDYSKTKQYQQGIREGKDDHAHNKDHSRKRTFQKGRRSKGLRIRLPERVSWSK